MSEKGFNTTLSVTKALTPFLESLASNSGDDIGELKWFEDKLSAYRFAVALAIKHVSEEELSKYEPSNYDQGIWKPSQVDPDEALTTLIKYVYPSLGKDPYRCMQNLGIWGLEYMEKQTKVAAITFKDMFVT